MDYKWNIPTWDFVPQPSKKLGSIAKFWTPTGRMNVRCGLCPHQCLIAPDKVGRCRVRRNIEGQLYSEVYAQPAAVHIDPIEKKPLRQYLPGSKTFSIGTFGCNLSCQFCQNDSLSRRGSSRELEHEELLPSQLVTLAHRGNCQSIAFTYNEPTVFAEYAIDCAKAAREAGLGVVLVSNGYISPLARAELYPLIDAANIDVKAFDNAFYQRLCGAEIAPVLESCIFLKKTCGKHLELTMLLIPGCNDSPAAIRTFACWVVAELGADTPVHFSAYYPAGGFSKPATPSATLHMAQEIAHDSGVQTVILGNLRS